MSTGQNQAGPGKRKKPRRIDGPSAAPRQEERDPLPASIYRNGQYDGGQTLSDTESVTFSQEPPVQAHSNGETQPREDGNALKDYLITMKEVMRRTSMCRGTIEYLMQHSDFPLPVKTGERGVRWWSGEVNEWMWSRPRAMGDLGKRHSRVEKKD